MTETIRPAAVAPHEPGAVWTNRMDVMRPSGAGRAGRKHDGNLLLETGMSTGAQVKAAARRLAEIGLEPLLLPELDAFAMLGVGRTKGHRLVKDGVLDTVMVGERRHVTMASLKRFAGINPSSKAKTIAEQPLEV